MAHREQGEEAPDLEPWANDVRLQDVTLQGKINKVVRIILRLAEAMEKAPIGPMPKTKSIPMMWEMVKELNQKNISALQDACREHAEYDHPRGAENRPRKVCARPGKPQEDIE